MPFDLTLIANANPAELHVVEFSNEDFKDKNLLEKLKTALLRFENLQFKLPKDITPQNKTIFIDFTIQLLEKNKALKTFDFSGNQFSVNALLPQQDAKPREKNERERDFLARLGKAPHQIRIGTAPKTFDDLLKNLLSSQTLKTLILQNNFLFVEKFWINNIRSAITQGYTKIDLRNTHRESECFTAEQLYTLIQPFSKIEKKQPFATITTKKPSCEILVSFNELPDDLQKKINAEQDWVNLTEIANSIIFNAYKIESLNQKIQSINQNSASNTSIRFPFPLNTLTEEETQRLDEVLKNNSTAEKLVLPICHLPSLVDAIKNHPSIHIINISKLGYDSQVLNSLKEIFAINSNIKHLICDYRLILQDEFKNVTEAVLNNPQSKLKHQDADMYKNKYIELEDTDNTLSSDPTTLKNLINKTKTQPADIRIVIDLSILNIYGLEYKLCENKLLPWPENSGFPCNYSNDQLNELRDPLIFSSGRPKLILTPSYAAHSKVMNCIISHLAKKEAENALRQQAEEEEAGETSGDEQELEKTAAEEPKNTASTSSTSDTSHPSDAKSEAPTKMSLC